LDALVISNSFSCLTTKANICYWRCSLCSFFTWVNHWRRSNSLKTRGATWPTFVFHLLQEVPLFNLFHNFNLNYTKQVKTCKFTNIT
jgi:hypothetical protein